MEPLDRLYRPGQVIQVQFLEWDDAPHYAWKAEVAEVSEGRVLTHLKAGSVFHHQARGYDLTVEHDGFVAFWAAGWFSGGPDLDPASGRVLEYYFNVNTPPEFTPAGITAVDLQLDVKVHPDHTARLFDEDEFAAAAERFRYPPWLARRAHKAAGDVLALVASGAWPMRPREDSPDAGWLDRGPAAP
ncbi:MAG TPA: DUF402 domain-containing protein [Deinococcales bacterium]|nr:DUF402 domain-containing protein [Deinococcales bacterium]